MKISLQNLAPAHDLLMQWMDWDQNESGLTITHHDGRVVAIGYLFTDALQMVAIELDTYEFEPFKPFGLGRAESEIILERSKFSGIHLFEDLMDGGQRQLRLSGIGSTYTANTQFTPNFTDLPNIGAEPVAWMPALLFERVQASYESYSYGPHKTDWGLRLGTTKDSNLVQIDAATPQVMATMVLECSRVAGDKACQFHMPPDDVTRLLVRKGNSQVSICDGTVASGNYSWYKKPVAALPAFQLAKSKIPTDCLTASVELTDLKRILGQDLEGYVKLTLDISKAKLVDFSTTDTDGNHIDRVMADDGTSSASGESTIALDRQFLSQAWAALSYGGKVDVVIGRPYEPMTITHRGFGLNDAIKYLQVLLMPMLIGKR